VLSNLIGFFQFAVVTFLSAVGVNLLLAILSHVYAGLLRAQAKEPQMRVRLAQYARLANGLAARVEDRKGRAAGAASQLFGAQRNEKALRSRIRELENSPYRFVRTLGAEQFPNKPYEFLVVNTSVSHQVKRGERHAFYDSSWAHPCPVHVWAPGPEEAKAEFERVYPRASGFKAVFAQPLTGVAAPSETEAAHAPAVQSTEMEPA
jgi:hypothetical protein